MYNFPWILYLLKNDQTFVLLIHPSSRSSSSHSFERFKSSIISKRSVCNWFAASLRLSGIFNIFFQDREHIEIRNIFSLRDDRNFVNSRAASELALSTAVDEAVMLCFLLPGNGPETGSFVSETRQLCWYLMVIWPGRIDRLHQNGWLHFLALLQQKVQIEWKNLVPRVRLQGQGFRHKTHYIHTHSEISLECLNNPINWWKKCLLPNVIF